MTKKVQVRPYAWKKFQSSPDEPNQTFHVEIYSHNRDSEPCLIRIQDFKPYFYAELPDRRYLASDITSIKEELTKKLGNHAPIDCALVKRKKLFFYQGDKVMPMLLLSFATEDAMRHCSNLLKKYPLRIYGLGELNIIPREMDIGVIKKLCALRKVAYVCWMSIMTEEVPLGDERRISKDNGFTHEYLASWKDISPIPEEECSLWSVDPVILSWDIEVLSYNPKIFPSALRVRDESFMIGTTLKRLSDTGKGKQVVFVYGEHDPIEGAEIRKYKAEVAMIHGFCDYIDESNADGLLTFNGLGFDFDYLRWRLSSKGEAWRNCSRIQDREPKLVSLDWSSAAYSKQELIYMDFDGRISIDMLPIIKRDYSLEQYNLDYCSKFFLGKGKIPLTPKQIFMYYKIAKGYNHPEIMMAARVGSLFPFLNDFRLHNQEAISRVVNVLETVKDPSERSKQVIAIYREYGPALMALIGFYCLVDTERPLELMQYLNTWTSLGELAEVVKVPIMDCFTRGQQVRVMSQLYDIIHEKGLYIDLRQQSDLPYVGGAVEHPKPGSYKDVVSFDFASLYPTIAIAYNIDFTTLVMDDSVPDECCNIIEWEEEGGEDAEIPDEENLGFSEVSGVKTVKRKYRFRFIKADIQKGVLPEMLERLLSKRKATRKAQKGLDPKTSAWKILEARQKALKVSANSGYGFLGVRKSKLPMLEAALCITAMGRFHIGKIMKTITEEEGGEKIYGDTDSAMVHFEQIARENLYAFGKAMAKKLSIPLPFPMSLEFERAYAYFFSLSAKRYAAVILKENGEVELDENELYKRGIVLARRDNCVLLKEVYREILLCILYNKGVDKALEWLMYYINLLMTSSMPLEKLTITKSIAGAYKSDTNVMAIFGRRLKEMGKPVQAGDRLEYVFVEAEQKLQGYKLALPEMLVEDPDKYKIDRLYYVEKSLMKPIQQLFEIGYGFHKHFMKKLHKTIEQKQNMVKQINFLQQQAMEKRKRRFVIV